jgi:spore germination cell wall hydrolase CwlJ-like protein
MRRLLTSSVVVAVILLAGLLGAVGHAQAYTPEEERLFALNLYHEARSGGREGMVAVGHLVLNRMKDKGFPNTIEAVINQGGPKPPCQWGWTCDQRKNEPVEGKLWEQAQEVAKQLLGPNPGADPTSGALWMHETRLKKAPAYTKKLRRVATIGGNHFYAR